MGAGGIEKNTASWLFSISVQLTEKARCAHHPPPPAPTHARARAQGFMAHKTVLDLIFQYIAVLRRVGPQARVLRDRPQAPRPLTAAAEAILGRNPPHGRDVLPLHRKE